VPAPVIRITGQKNPTPPQKDPYIDAYNYPSTREIHQRDQQLSYGDDQFTLAIPHQTTTNISPQQYYPQTQAFPPSTPQVFRPLTTQRPVFLTHDFSTPHRPIYKSQSQRTPFTGRRTTTSAIPLPPSTPSHTQSGYFTTDHVMRPLSAVVSASSGRTPPTGAMGKNSYRQQLPSRGVMGRRGGSPVTRTDFVAGLTAQGGQR
jgi:hypothetical protein